jgi:hypothetical protein
MKGNSGTDIDSKEIGRSPGALRKIAQSTKLPGLRLSSLWHHKPPHILTFSVCLVRRRAWNEFVRFLVRVGDTAVRSCFVCILVKLHDLEGMVYVRVELLSSF